MKKFWTALVLTVLLVSSFPVGLAQNEEEPKPETFTFQCDTGKLTFDEIQTINKELYGDGFQSRAEVTPGPTHSLDQNIKTVVETTPEKIMEKHNNNTNPNAEGAEIADGEISTADGERKYDFDVNKGCVSCDYFSFTSGSDTPYFACAKDLTTRVGYCEGGVDKCLGELSQFYKTEGAAGLLAEFLAPDRDQIMAINDFKFYQRNGAFSPTDYDTLVYSDVQKTYDNYLPFATVISIFVPNPIGVFTKAKRAVTSLGPWLKTIGKGDEVKTVFRLGKTTPYFSDKGSQIIASSNYISKGLADAKPILEAVDAGDQYVDDIVRNLGTRVSEMQTKVGEPALANFKGLVGPEFKSMDINTFNKAFQEQAAMASQIKGYNPSKTMEGLVDSFTARNIVDAEADSVKALIAQGLNKGKFADEKVAKEVLEAIGLKNTVDDGIAALVKSDEIAVPELSRLIRGAGFKDTAKTSAEDVAGSILTGFKKAGGAGDEAAEKWAKDQLSGYGIKADLDDFIKNAKASEGFSESFSASANSVLRDNLQAADSVSTIETVSAAQQGKLKKLSNIVLGTTKTKTSASAGGVI